MLGSTVDSDALRRTDSGMQTNQWHRDAAGNGRSQSRPGTSGTSASSSAPANEGTWGERDVGGVSEQHAIHEYETLRHNLLQLHRTRDSQASKTTSAANGRSQGKAALEPTRSVASGAAATDVEGQATDTEGGETFELADFMREGHFEKRTEAGSEKRVGVVYKNLAVKGTGSTTSVVRTVPDAVLGTFGPDLYHLLCRWLPFIKLGHTETRTLIHDYTGCVRDGEMMLVLGRPVSCSCRLHTSLDTLQSWARLDK